MALSTEFCSVEENHDEQSNVGIKRQNLSLPLEYAILFVLSYILKTTMLHS